MRRLWRVSTLGVVLFVFGCTQPVAPAIQPGDTVRPEVSFAPADPWPAGAKVTVGVLARVERPGGGSHYLKDQDVPAERVVVRARVSFWDGERPLGEPSEVPLVHDC